MEILRIAGFALCSVVLITALSRYSPWAALLISLAGGLSIVLYLLPMVALLADRLSEIFSLIDGGNGYVALLLRVIGISFIAQITAQICTDAGQKAMGDKVEIAARVFIAIYCIPLISDMLRLISGFLGG